jgi:hypothetical protein
MTTVGRPLVSSVGAVDRLGVVPVDHDRMPTERLRALPVRVGVPAEHRLAALAEPVDIEDRRQVVELVVRSVVERLPDRSLGRLAVAVEHPDVGRHPVEVLGAQRHSDPDRESLSERTGGYVHPGQHRSRVALEAAAVLPVSQQLLVVDRANRPEDRIEEGRGMAFGEDEPVVPQVVRAIEVVAEVFRDQHGHQVGRGHARGGVPGLGGGRRPDGVHPELLAKLAPELDVVHAGNVTIWS